MIVPKHQLATKSEFGNDEQAQRKVFQSFPTLLSNAARRFTFPASWPNTINMSLNPQDMIETIQVIGEVDVAYTHDGASDNFVYDVWFKASGVRFVDMLRRYATLETA